MILGVIEGQIRGGYFPDCILDPSVIDPSEQEASLPGVDQLLLGEQEVEEVLRGSRRWRRC